MSPYKVTIQITGIKGPDMYDEVQRLAGNLYLKGTDEHIFADVPSDEVGPVLANLNATPGLKAERLQRGGVIITV